MAGMQRWRGKVAVVTGASSGIGEAIAAILAENEMVVVGLARRIDRMQELAAKSKGNIHPIKCDLTNKEEILETFRQIEQKFGGVDVLINNAAFVTFSHLSDGPIEDWEKLLDTNILALSICTREALKTMRQRGDNGQIININSIAGHRIFPMSSLSMYSASKHAVTALTTMLRNELREKKSKIRISSLSPGLVHTQMAVDMVKITYNQDFVPDESQMHPPALYPHDIADVVVFMLSSKPYVEIQEVMVESTGKMV